MELTEFVAQITDFDALSSREKICLFAWFLHVHRGMDVFSNAKIRRCFQDLASPEPQIARDLPRMAERKPPDLIRVGKDYRLEGSIKRQLDQKYGLHPKTVLVTKLLLDLPTAIPNLTERAFLSEAIDCYRVGAFRAAIVMAWNLSFDHITQWILSDAKRASEFNAAIGKRYPKRSGFLISRIDHFEELKEFEVIEILASSGLVSRNTVDILKEKLKRRNMAAHPSQVIVSQAQADDVITDLVNNVITLLT